MKHNTHNKKVCSVCKIEKDLSMFHKDRSKQDGHHHRCKPCKSLYNSVYKRSPKGKEADKRYKRTPHGKVARRAQGVRRREKQRLLDTNFTLEDALFIHTQFDGQCYNCKTKDKLTFDHHLPISKGYALSQQNAVILCRSCNSSKGAKYPWEFYSMAQMNELNFILNLNLPTNKA